MTKATQTRAEFRRGLQRAAYIARGIKDNYPEELFTGQVHDSRVVEIIRFTCELVAKEIEKRYLPPYPGPEESDKS